jgi:hypothetical protein
LSSSASFLSALCRLLFSVEAKPLLCLNGAVRMAAEQMREVYCSSLHEWVLLAFHSKKEKMSFLSNK